MSSKQCFANRLTCRLISSQIQVKNHSCSKTINPLQTICKIHSSDHVVQRKNQGFFLTRWSVSTEKKTIGFEITKVGDVASGETPRIEIFAGKMKGSNHRQEPNQRHSGGLKDVSPLHVMSWEANIYISGYLGCQ